MTEIDLGKLTNNEVSMLTGHPRGLKARELYQLDLLDRLDGSVVMRAPRELDTITPSFVQGFLAKSLSNLGESGLRKHYDFSGLPKILQSDIETGIQRLLLHGRGAVN